MRTGPQFGAAPGTGPTLVAMRLLKRFEIPGATREDWIADATLAALSIVLGLVPYLVMAWLFDARQTPEMMFWSAVTSLVAGGAIVIRRSYPLLFMGTAALALLVQVVFVPTPTVAILVVPLASYTVARLVPGLASRSVVVCGAVGAVLGPIRWISLPYGNTSASAFAAILAAGVCVGLVITPYAMGRRARDVAAARDALLEAEAERYQILLSEREHEARAAEANARNQIARELHDIVAHSLSVIVVQAEGGRRLATKQPEAAGETLATIATTGREALSEMRRIVSVLRAGDEEPTAYAPSPGLEDIPAMVEKTEARLVVDGEPPTVVAGLGLTAYRVVQEALTNVLKHAGPGADPVVTLSYRSDEITIDVSDSGIGARATSDGGGHGLRGMEERVGSHGGRLVAGPRERGYQVRAWLPVRAPEPGRISS